MPKATRTIHQIKTAGSRRLANSETLTFSSIDISVKLGEECTAELKASGVKFYGKGDSAFRALEDLMSAIADAGETKPNPLGRTPNRVRVAHTLIDGGTH
jgi:hypothetical protein